MKAISLHQYWSSLIAADAKRIETRSFGVRYRGPLAIQAAKKIPGYAREEYSNPKNRVTRSVLRTEFGVRRAAELCMLPTQCVVVVCNLVDCVRVTRATRLESLDLLMPGNRIPDKYQTPGWLEFGNFETGRWLWFLDNIRRLREPVPCRGYQGFFDLPADILSQVVAQI